MTRDLGGGLVATHRYRAFVSVVTQEVTDAKQALVNPLGLYVTNLTWGEVVTTGNDSQTGNGGNGTNEVARGNTDGSPNCECGGGRVSPTAPALTPQQKQELSTYDFKGAESALEAQDNQPASKASPLTPIPPLKVPPITSRSPVAQPLPGGAAADKGSEVPLELDTASRGAERRRGQRDGGFSSMGERGCDANAGCRRPGGLHLWPGDAGHGLRSATGLRY